MCEISLKLLTLIVFVSLNIEFLKGQNTPDPLSILISEVFGVFNETADTSNNRTSFPEPAQQSCDCVPVNECRKYNNSEIPGTNYGEGVIDIRFGRCPQPLEVCCDEKNTHTNKRPIPVPYKRTVKCGFRNENGVGFRISAGNSESQFGEFPWMIALLTTKELDNGTKISVYHCGGSLIHPKVVLTAAHCVISSEKKPETIILRAGEWDSKSEDELIPYQERMAHKIIVHKDFKSGPLFNDIALIILKESFEYIENVDIVCLPNQHENVDFQKCVASGWGKNEFGEQGVYSNILKRVDLPMIPRNECHQRLTETRLGKRFVLHESFLCAGGIPNQDTCKGDGGSPLMCPIPGNKDHYQQVGIVSWGVGCGNNIPAVYVNIPYLRSWIDEQFVDNSLDLVYHNEKY